MASDIDPARADLLREARLFPTRLARVRDFLAAPADLTAYIAGHCADIDVLTSAPTHGFTFAAAPRYGTAAAPEGAFVRVCANETYLADAERCARARAPQGVHALR